MKANKLAIFILIAALLLLAGCKEESHFSTLRLEIDKGTRTISPNESSMEICCYKIILTDPNGDEWGERLTYHSYCSFDDLYPGKWKIEVYGQNTSRESLAYGAIEVTLKEGDNSAYVEVNQLIGKGSLDVRITWDPSKVQNPELSLFLAKQGEKEEKIATPTLDKIKGEALLILNNLDSGSYTLRGELYSGNAAVGGFAEAIRISNGETSTGTIIMVKSGLPESNESITVSDMTSIPLEADIEGVNQLVPVNSKLSASLNIKTKNVSQNDISVSWYIDGILVHNGQSLSYVAAEKGLHRIDAIYSTATVGSSGSSTTLFTVVDNVKDGMPYQVTMLKSSEDFSLTESHVARFLQDGKIIIADNTELVMTIIEQKSDGTFEYYQTPYSTLKIQDTYVSDIVSAGGEEDSSSTVYLICNDSPKIIALNYTAKSNLLSWIRTEENLYDQGDMNLIRKLGPATLFRNKAGNIEFVFVAAATKNNTNVGVYLLNTKASADTSFIESNLVAKSIYVDGPIISLVADRTSSTVTALSSNAANVYHFYKLNEETILEQNPILFDGDIPSDRTLFDTGISGWITNYEIGNGFLLHERGIIITTRVPGATTCIETSGSIDFTSAGVPVPFISGSSDGEYFYIFDRYGKRLHMATFEEKYGFDLNTGNDYIILDSDLYSDMTVSPKGDQALISAPNRLDRILILDIIR